MSEEIITYYKNGLIESREIKKEDKIEIVVYNRNGQCIYSSSKDYEVETEMNLHLENKRYSF